jgi:hypothetical protein
MTCDPMQRRRFLTLLGGAGARPTEDASLRLRLTAAAPVPVNETPVHVY